MAKDQPKRAPNSGSFKKGNKATRAGVQNKTTRAAKEAFALAFDQLGGVEALAKWAKLNPTDFYKLYARLIPVDVTSGGERLSISINIPPLDDANDAKGS